MDLESVTEWSNSESGKQISYINPYMWNLKKIGTDDLIYKAEIETQTYRKKLMDTKGGRGEVGWVGRLRLHLYTVDTMYKIGN